MLIQARTEAEWMRKALLMLRNACGQAGIHCPSVNDPLEAFAEILFSSGTRGLVLLIDEYDAPLTHHLHEPDVFALQEGCLESLFSIIKNGNEYLRFFMMIGVTKFSHTGIFSGFNDLKDISCDVNFGSLLGYTDGETETCFGEYLENAGRVVKLDRKDLLSALRRNYDGYCFTPDTSVRVYAPWSVLNFLQSPEKGFFNWWYESAGQPAVLKNFSEIRGLDSPSVFFNERKVGVGKFYAGQEYEDLDETLLLFQGGYLSIEKFGDNEVSFRYPNEEVSDSLARYCAEKLLGGRSADDVGIENLIRALDADDPSRVIADFNRILTGIPCDSAFIGSENWCRNALALVLQGARVRTAAERHNAFGRSDLEIFRSHVHWFFEFKFARSNDLLERRLNEAEAQLRSRRYGEDDLSDRRMIRVAAVFSGTNRRISAWRRVDDAKLSDA